MVGAGIIGAACARRLAQEGATVVVVDDEAGRAQATWASAGLLLDGAGHEHPPEWFALAQRSIALWPEIAAACPNVTLRRTGVLLLGVAPEWIAWREENGYENRAERWQGGPAVLFPEVMTIRPDLVADALLDGIDVRSRHVEDLTGLRRQADLVIVAAGAWAGPLLAEVGIDVDVAPRRGQMLLFDGGQLPHVLLSADCEEVAVPRSDGRIVVGTTLEDVGFDAATDSATIDRLEEWGRRMVPGLGRRLESWAGLRPWSDRPLPTVARVADDVIVAAGHFRNGLLLAPETAERVRDLAYAGAASPVR